MITNRQIHDIANKAYAKRSGRERTGYSVRWEVRNSADGSVKVVKMMHAQNDYADCDVAGYMSKADAYRLAKLLVKDGYTGVRAIRTVNVDKGMRSHEEGNDVVFSADWTPETISNEVDPKQFLSHVYDYLTERVIGRGSLEFNEAESWAAVDAQALIFCIMDAEGWLGVQTDRTANS